PTTITPTLNNIVNYLNIFSDAGNRLERLLTNLQTQLANSQTQLGTLQNDYDLLHQAYEAHRMQHSIFKSRELDGRITISLAQERMAVQLGVNLRHEIQHIEINRPISELLTELEEIERYKAEQLFEAYLYSNSDSKKAHRKDNYSSMTETE
ncbi:6290_t:CDS:2, partial [Cetraspora pellucida]